MATSEPISLEGFVEFEPDYWVNREGIVLASTNWKGTGIREIRTVPDKDGYRCIRVSIDGARRKMRVHKLVAIAFLPPRRPGEQIRHLDGDRTNNDVSNLAWGTSAENARDRAEHGRTASGSRNGNSKLNEEQVVAIKTMLYEGIATKEIAHMFGVCFATISQIRTGRIWSHVQSNVL